MAAPAAAEKPASEAVDETWEEKEDKQNPKPVVPKTEPAEQKYQYKEGVCVCVCVCVRVRVRVPFRSSILI